MKLGKEIRMKTLPEIEVLRVQLNLSDDELEVFNLLAKGKSIVAISDSVNLCPASVSNRIKCIREKMRKLDATND